MADLSDVEDALASLVATTLYPSGESQGSILGSTCRIYRGWPNNAALNNDLANGVINVTVSADNDVGHTTTRYLATMTGTPGVPGVQALVAAGVIRITGQPMVGDVVGAVVDGASYSYRISLGDTVDLVAANLGALIQAQRPVRVIGPTIAVPGSWQVDVRSVADGRSQQEVRRQEKGFRVATWCPTPETRDSTCSTIDAALSGQAFLKLSDATFGRLQYKNTMTYDQGQNALLYRRDLVYLVEYASILTAGQASMVFGASVLDGNTLFG